jgi:hypothetical protein
VLHRSEIFFAIPAVKIVDIRLGPDKVLDQSAVAIPKQEMASLFMLLMAETDAVEVS